MNQIKVLLLLALVLSGCHIRNQRDESIAWQNQNDRLTKTEICNVRANFSGNANDQNIRADLIFNYNRKLPHLRGILRGPFGDTAAKIEVFRTNGVFSDAQGSRPILQEPVFRELFKDDWTVVMDFLLGIVRKKSSTNIRANSQLQPIIFEKADRLIECRYESSAARPASCSIETKALKAKIDFTSVDCRETLS